MQNKDSRETLRQIYQREDTSNKTYIPAKPKINPNEKDRFFRVCAYCRVSTDNDEQLSSFELQQAHYKQLVQDHPNWELKHIFADQGISGTSLRGITSLMSDYYYRYAYQDASVLMEVYTELVRTAAASMRTTLQAANCYLWPYAHALSDMPVSGSSYTYVDREVPLLAIALSGRMPLYAEYVNFQANNRRFFLQMVEQGARPCFLLTHADPILLQNSNSSDIYSSAYALYRETISSWYTELSALHDALGASSIVSHETDGDLTKVTWDNGTVVCLNFSDEPAQMDGMNIEGLSYKVVK